VPSYIKVVWHHRPADEPVELYSEIDDSRWELRKVEVYRDGRHDFADATQCTGTTLLSDQPLPTLDQIAVQTEFTPIAIERAEFEDAWLRATRGLTK